MLRAMTTFWCLLLLAAGAVSADTIVLKNGRRITATSVVEEGDRVYYETRAGRLSLRRDLVERIERGGAASAWAAAAGPAGEMEVSAPRMDPTEGYDDVAAAVVKGGSVDRNLLLQLELDAQSGGASAARKVAAAHHAAAQHLLARAEVEQAMGHYRRALTFAPEHTGVLLYLSYLHLQRSEFTPALEYLERARRVEPNSADVAKLMGWAYYGSNRIEQAVTEWKRALALRPDADVEQALAKAVRDEEAESDYREGETRHFNLRYHGDATPQLAREILRALEYHFGAIESELRFTPPEPIGVILYTEQAFADITRAPGWVGALNDGRIRVPVQGLTSMTQDLSQTLKHELTHSFIHQKTLGRAPVWLHEGVAQWMEGQRAGQYAQVLVAAYDQKVSLPLRAMEGSFLNLPGDVASYAYAWSLGVVEFIVSRNGMSDVERILERINSDPSTEAATRNTLRLDYEQLEAEAVTYLRRTYLR
jgi:tetratricopeptide (TPR) repeat protein